MVYLKLQKLQIKMSVPGADPTSVTFFQVSPQTLQNVNLSLMQLQSNAHTHSRRITFPLKQIHDETASKSGMTKTSLVCNWVFLSLHLQAFLAYLFTCLAAVTSRKLTDLSLSDNERADSENADLETTTGRRPLFKIKAERTRVFWSGLLDLLK